MDAILMRCATVLASAALLWIGSAIPASAQAGMADYLLGFNKDIRPILSDNCFTCHGQDSGSRKAGLRLDIREEALKGGKSEKPAIVPEKPDNSDLIRRILTADEDDAMPPHKTGKVLKKEQIATLKRWVEEGASYEPHWAFVAPTRPVVPHDKAHPHPIDGFVTARLKAESLRLSPEADRVVLLRRLALDLTGIPPTPAMLDAFLKDRSSQAYEKQVTALLASPHFGEKWARHWLDAARYADSDGFEKDLPRQQWTWRDWVIRSINQDLPYDQFVVEQVAGDLLPNATQDQRIATGFLRNGMVNEEGAIIAEQFRLEGLFDRMDCLGKAVLGITLQCAQCHSHKFDPLTHDEYYRFLAYINNDYEAVTPVYTSDQLKEIERITRETKRLVASIKSKTNDWQKQLADWEAKLKSVQPPWQILAPSFYEWMGGLSHPEELPDKSILTLGFRPTAGELETTVTNFPSTITGLRLEALTHGDLPFGGPGRSYKGSFAISELEVLASAHDSTNWTRLGLTNATADFSEPEHDIEQFFRTGDKDARKLGPASFLIDGKDDTAWSSDRGPGRRHQSSVWMAQFASTNNWPTGDVRLKFILKYRHGGEDGHGRQNNFLGRFRLAATTSTNAPVDPLPVDVTSALNTPAEKRSPAQSSALFNLWRLSNSDFKAINAEIDSLWSRYPEGESVLNLAQRDPEFKRSTFLLDRGSWQKPSRKVSAGTPAFLHSLPKDADDSRLALARWLVDPRSPTTARVFVNRVWQSVFGMGLVETAEDFGVRAAEPSHPELLDWLAVEFMEPSIPADGGPPKPWSLKQLLFTIVTSDTYKQSSRSTSGLLEKDPRNRLLARGPRFRAEAEVVRDIALSASGLLNENIGGPSVFPPVPESLFSQSYLKVDFWKTAIGADRYRRSIYTFRRRSMPDPALSSFDAPNADFACVRRVRSNTPLAALTSLNETVFIEASQALALRILREGGSTDRERAQYGFRLCTGRTAKSSEINEVLALLQSRKDKLAEGWLPAREIAFGSPDKIPELPRGASPKDVAAWTIAGRVLLNLDETVTKN